MRERNTLRAVVRFPKLSALPTIIARLRRVFDLGADPDAIGAHLAEDPILAPLVSARPGLRVPGAWDGFELAIRAVLGQQVTVTAAAGLAAKLVATYGDPLRAAGLAALGSTPVDARVPRRTACDADVIDARPAPAADGLTHVFPRPERLAGADLSTLGMPRARAATLSALAAAVVRDPHMFGARQTLEDAVLQLRAVPGVGEWTAQYIALRALREPDAFPAADIGLLRAMEDEAGRRPTPRDLLARAERWRPWRAYAAQHLWAAQAAGAGTDADRRGGAAADRRDPAHDRPLAAAAV
jgi:AraC family transcriptional regulator of adaptative response / DNA-3-methyladenine glycosylase II